MTTIGRELEVSHVKATRYETPPANVRMSEWIAGCAARGLRVGSYVPRYRGYEISAVRPRGRKPKLTGEQQEEIRALCALYRALRKLARKINPQALGKRYAVTEGVITRIELGVPYKHAQGPSSPVTVTRGSAMEKWEPIARLLEDLDVDDGKAQLERFEIDPHPGERSIGESLS